jgi:purine-binding chemotaxis protein CheW
LVLTRQQFCTFFVNGRFFGIPVDRVQEVIQWQDITRVPLASDVIEGLINLRGDIVMAVDLRRRLAIGDRPAAVALVNVVVRCADGPASLLVDSIGDVVEVDQNGFENSPPGLDANMRTVITGIYKLPGKLMHVLDIDSACQILNDGEPA